MKVFIAIPKAFVDNLFMAKTKKSKIVQRMSRGTLVNSFPHHGIAVSPPKKTLASGYVIIVKPSTHDGYMFTYIERNYLSYSTMPRMIFKDINEDLRMLWHRIAIDKVYEWDCPADSSTARIVKIDFTTSDVTFRDETDAHRLTKAKALGRITGEEAKVLGIDRDWVIATMMRKEPNKSADEQLLRDVEDMAFDWKFDIK
jgi:hypothetical protein